MLLCFLFGVQPVSRINYSPISQNGWLLKQNQRYSRAPNYRKITNAFII